MVLPHSLIFKEESQKAGAQFPRNAGNPSSTLGLPPNQRADPSTPRHTGEYPDAKPNARESFLAREPVCQPALC